MRVESPCSAVARSTSVGHNKNNADHKGGAYRLILRWSLLESRDQSRVAGSRHANEAIDEAQSVGQRGLLQAFRCVPASETRTTFTDYTRSNMNQLIKRFLRDDRGVTAIEYALIAGLIAAAIATMVGNIGTNINSVFTAVAAAIKPS